MPSVLPSRQRMLDLAKLSSQIFNTTFNPTGARIGTSVLRQRLTGHLRAQWYPPRLPGIRELRLRYPEYEFEDEDEEQRLEDVELRKERGKGAPKKSKGKKVAQGRGKKK